MLHLVIVQINLIFANPFDVTMATYENPMGISFSFVKEFVKLIKNTKYFAGKQISTKNQDLQFIGCKPWSVKYSQ